MTPNTCSSSVRGVARFELQGCNPCQTLAVVCGPPSETGSPVRSLRGEWSQFQRYARARRQAQGNPGDMEAAKQLAREVADRAHPGERGAREAEKRRREGIPLPAPVVEELRALARALHMEEIA